MHIQEHPSVDTAAHYLGAFDFNLYTVPAGFAVAQVGESPNCFYAETATAEGAVAAFNRHYFATHI